MPQYKITEEWIDVYTGMVEANDEEQAANKAMSVTTYRESRRRVVTIEQVSKYPATNQTKES